MKSTEYWVENITSLNVRKIIIIGEDIGKERERENVRISILPK